jgi:phage shock protein E
MAVNVIKDKILSGAIIVDVRTKDEFMDGSYPGAINIPVNVLPKRLDEFRSKDKPIVVYCASGSRSAVAMTILKAHGFVDVTNAGGLDDMPT